MIKGTGQRLIPRKLLEWIKGLNKGEGASLNITTLTDSNGNPRFIEGNGVPMELEGFTSTYCKWSLSGTHLMFVLAGSIANTTVVPSSKIVAYFDIPEFVFQKIYPVWRNKYLESTAFKLFADDWTSQNISIHFYKSDNTPGRMGFENASAVTLTADRKFRIQFDLLIDSE